MTESKIYKEKEKCADSQASQLCLKELFSEIVLNHIMRPFTLNVFTSAILKDVTNMTKNMQEQIS